MQKLFNFMSSHYPSFLLVARLQTSTEEVFAYTIASKVFLALSCTNFRVSVLILQSLIHFEFIQVQGDRHGSSFSFLQADSHFSKQHLLKRLSILHHVLGDFGKKNKVTIDVQIHIQILYSVPLVFISVCASTMLFLLLWLYSIV
jgi:hypothetical protein